MGLDLRPGDRRLRPPPHRHLAPPAPRPWNAPPPGLEREARLGRLGKICRAPGGSPPPLPGPRPLGLLSRIFLRDDGPSKRRSKRRNGRPSRYRPDPLRRRPPRIPGRSLARNRREVPRLPGRLLTPPQCPPEQEVTY